MSHNHRFFDTISLAFDFILSTFTFLLTHQLPFLKVCFRIFSSIISFSYIPWRHHYTWIPFIWFSPHIFSLIEFFHINFSSIGFWLETNSFSTFIWLLWRWEFVLFPWFCIFAVTIANVNFMSYSVMIL